MTKKLYYFFNDDDDNIICASWCVISDQKTKKTDAGLRGCDRILLHDVREDRHGTVVGRESRRGSRQVPAKLVDELTLHKQLRETATIGQY